MLLSDKEPIDYEKFGLLTEGMSGAEVTLVCREAGLKALTEDMNIEKEGMDEVRVTNQHILKAIEEVKNRGKKDQSKSLFS